MKEALRFFEMDMMLSVIERETSQMLSPLVYYFYYINHAMSCVVSFPILLTAQFEPFQRFSL